MQPFGDIAGGYMDVAQVTLYAFWIFFFGLIIYIRREDTREGYPLETDVKGKVRRKNFIFFPKAKEYKRPHGEGSYFAPSDDRDTREVKARRMAPWPGAALVPTGDPMEDGVGPAAWAERPKTAELAHDGDALVVPLRTATQFRVAKPSRDPRGFEVRGCDGQAVGTVSDIWVDRAEQSIRHLEVDVGGTTVILPMGFAKVDLDRPRVTVAAITGSQFGKIPKLSNRDQITQDEEERIRAYYGGGYMYATPKRAEPLV